MKHFTLIRIGILALLLNSVSAQQNVREVKSNSFIIDVKLENQRYTDEKKENITIRDYYEFTDPSRAGYYKLPYKEIIIALPPNIKPTINIISKSERVIEHIIPAINPVVESIKDSVLIYTNVDYKDRIKENANKPLVEIKSYSWLRNYYCANILIRTHSYDENSGKITELKNIKLEIKLPGNISLQSNAPLSIKSEFDKTLQKIIYNYQIAGQFKSNLKIAGLDTTGNWIDYGKVYVKIGTAADGLFRIYKSDLENLGVSTSAINPQTFKLFESGKEQTIFIKGEEDGSFDENDYIEFYGSLNYSKISYRTINLPADDYNEYLNRYTDTTFYFLCWDGSKGQRASSLDKYTEGVTDTINYYLQKLHYEKNVTVQNLFDGEVENNTPGWKRNKTWIWGWLGTSSYNYTFQTSDLYPNKNCNIFFKAISGGSGVPLNSHNVLLSLNSIKLDSQVVNRYDQILLKNTVNSNSLSENNTITFTNYPNGTSPNSIALDWYDVDYPRSIKLVDDSLRFTISDEVNSKLRVVHITNATKDDLVIYKVKPVFKKITNFYLSKPDLFFTDTVKGGDTYVVIPESKIQKPVFYFAKRFENIRSTIPQVDYIAITHPKFISAVQGYLNSISEIYPVSTFLVNVENIFNEFRFGYPTPEAIKSYLKYYIENGPDPKPSYLCLIGDADYDYKKYRFKNDGVIGGGNYVPSYGFPVGDNWYVAFNDSLPIPQMKVGRIPVNDPTELTYYLNKVRNNFNLPYDEWNKKFIFFSGGDLKKPEEVRSLKAVNDSIIAKYIIPPPIAGSYSHFYKTENPVSDFGPVSAEQFQKDISNGSLFISYIGHSGTSTWDNSIMETEQLKNSVNRNPLITDFGCSTNKFAEPDILCFGEKFVLSTEGQALGYIGNSSLGFLSTTETVPVLFYKNILLDSLNEVGNALVNSKIEMFNKFGSSPDYKLFALTNSLIGDPVVRIKIPHKPNLNITNSSIELSNSIINEGMDSVAVKIIIKNLGISTGNYFFVDLQHLYNSEIIESKKVYVKVPDYLDTLVIWIKTKNLTGNHLLTVKLDPENLIDEIYKNDNQAQFEFNVYPLNVRDLVNNVIENGSISSLLVLNPSIEQNESLKIIYNLSEDDKFTNHKEGLVEFLPFYTKLSFSNLNTDKRYWFRYRLNNPGAEFSQVKSFYNSFSTKFLIKDSVSMNNQTYLHIKNNNGTITFIKDTVRLSVISAGKYAGNFNLITKNGINLLTSTVFAGMGIAVFDEKTLAIDTVQWYQLFNEAGNMQQLVNLINSIPQNKIVLMGVADDAANNITTDLKNAIKTLGSTKIDSLVFRSSWAIIGKKGATPGSCIEQVKGPYDGSIVIDSVFSVDNNFGTMVTNKIGPSAGWKNIKLSYNKPEDSKFLLRPIGIKQDGTVDSLSYLALNDWQININSISASKYPYIKLLAEFNAASSGASPVLNFLSVDYTGIPELGTNYQVVSINKDSVAQGDSTRLKFDVYNVGESEADSFRVKVDLVKPDNSHKTLFDALVEKLDPMAHKHFELNYIAGFYNGYGSMTLEISIDPQNKIKEIYEDNNIYQVPFFVIRDTTPSSVTSTSLRVMFDGNDISDGEFISPSPNIQMTLNYPIWFPVKDTNAFQVYLDDKKVSYRELSIASDTIGRKIIYKYNPKLTEGEHSLNIYGKNIVGNLESQPGYQKMFQVSSELKLLDVYNYPNPFSQNTYFTFKLTQIPDELAIKIFTVAGRLIKGIKLSSSELKFDFNHILWDGKDDDGNNVANGVYLYKLIAKKDGKTQNFTQKLAIVR
jgi:hypothetical protein